MLLALFEYSYSGADKWPLEAILRGLRAIYSL
nr:MAG TPA: hypothetical protein [Caudoviricetes sp.]